jgi:hypothetical protein
MAQQYGFRASRSLAEVEDRNACLDNLGIDRRDLALLVGTSDSGVTDNDYQAIIGLTSDLEAQIVVIDSGATVAYNSLDGVASKFGDTFIGTISGDIINNDRPYYDAGNTIYGPSTQSFFSPVSGTTFSGGAEYKLGPVSPTTLTVSGLDYVGDARDWNAYFVQYKNYLNVQEEPSWTTKKVPLYLPPPSEFDSNVAWLDSEFSSFVENGGVEVWRDVLGRSSATQAIAIDRPVLTANRLNGKPGVVFDGSNDFLDMGNLSNFFPDAATLVIVATIGEPNARGDGDYNLFGTLNNTGNRWRDSSGNGDFGLFTNSVLTGFPGNMPANGTYVFTVKASNSFGIEIRANQTKIGSFDSITYDAGSNYIIGANVNGSSGLFNGTIYAIALFNEVLSDKETKTVEEYFGWRYDFSFDPDRSQDVELENETSLTDENGVTIVLG